MVNIGGANTGNDRRGLSFLVFVGIIGFSIARAVATFFTNYLWFDSVDLNSVWLKILITKSALVAATSLLAFAFIFINLRLAVRATPVMDIFESFDSQDPLSRFREFVNERFLKYRLWGAIGLSLFLGALVRLYVTNQFQQTDTQLTTSKSLVTSVMKLSRVN